MTQPRTRLTGSPTASLRADPSRASLTGLDSSDLMPNTTTPRANATTVEARLAKLLVVAMFVASFLLVGCSGGGGDTQAPVGEVKTSKIGAEEMKKNGGRGGGAATPKGD